MKKIEKKEPELVEDEPIKINPKDKMIWVRLPFPLLERFNRQCDRLSCGNSTLARMAVVKFVEEEEFKEREMNKK